MFLKIEAVAAPPSENLRLLLASKVQSSIVTAPVVVTSLPVSPELSRFPSWKISTWRKSRAALAPELERMR